MVEVFSDSSSSLRYNTFMRFDRLFKKLPIGSSPITVPFESIMYTTKTIENTTDHPHPFSVDIMPQYSSLSASCLRKGTILSYTHTHTHTSLTLNWLRIMSKVYSVPRAFFGLCSTNFIISASYFLRVTVQVQHCYV
jgi:hypothetical protein